MTNTIHKGIGSLIVILIVAAVLIVVGGGALASADTNGGEAGVWSAITSLFRGSGNGAPSGTHYGLNIIGVPRGKTADMTNNQGHRIFVSLGSANNPITSKILLQQSTDGSFAVLDANGTDGSASFKLPAPGTYSIWARPLGKVGGTANMTTCATDVTTGTEVCSTSSEIFLREGGKSQFRNVTTALTSITIDDSLTALIDACGSQTVSLFDACLQDYFWSYDNAGLKLLQVRFYPN